MSNPLIIVARIIAKPDQIEVVKAELLKLIDPTLQEAGCIQYDLHQDNENPAIFLLYEIWESRALWQDHLQSSHIDALKNATVGTIESSEISEMTKL